MHILITTQVFPPEIHPTAKIVQELAVSMANSGHKVTVATGYPNHPHGRVFGGYKKNWLLRENFAGTEVIRGWHITSTWAVVPIRALAFLSQALGTAMASLATDRPDVIINFGPPIVGPVMSAFLSGLRGGRFIPVVYDIYPDVAIESGAVRNRTVIWLAKVLEKWIYRKSDRVVVLSEGFRRTLSKYKKVPGEKIRVIPVWIDLEEMKKTEGRNGWRASHGIPDDTFIVIYAGTMGLVSGAEVMVEVAREWAEDAGVLFLFVGDGKKKNTIRRKTTGLPNVRFLDFQPREQVAAMLSSADVGVMTLLRGQGRTSVPSKVLGYMAAEVPVMASCDLDSDSALMIQTAECGIVVAPGDPVAISGALRMFYMDRTIGREAGKRGRAYLEKYHSRDVGTMSFCELVRELESSTHIGTHK